MEEVLQDKGNTGQGGLENGEIMEHKTVVMANPEIVFREEFDDWAVLFNPETGDGFGINPIGAYIWKQLNGKHTIDDITQMIKKDCDDTPDDVGDFVSEFIDQLVRKHCAGMVL